MKKTLIGIIIYTSLTSFTFAIHNQRDLSDNRGSFMKVGDLARLHNMGIYFPDSPTTKTKLNISIPENKSNNLVLTTKEVDDFKIVVSPEFATKLSKTKDDAVFSPKLGSDIKCYDSAGNELSNIAAKLSFSVKPKAKVWAKLLALKPRIEIQSPFPLNLKLKTSDKQEIKFNPEHFNYYTAKVSGNKSFQLKLTAKTLNSLLGLADGQTIQTSDGYYANQSNVKLLITKLLDGFAVEVLDKWLPV